MSIRCMTRVWEHSQHKGSSLLMLLAIADYASDDGTNAFPSVATLAQKTRMSERHVQRILSVLEESGELVIERRNVQTNMYTVLVGGVKMSPLDVAGVTRESPGGEAGVTPGVTRESPDPLLNRNLTTKNGIKSKDQTEWTKVLADLQNNTKRPFYLQHIEPTYVVEREGDHFKIGCKDEDHRAFLEDRLTATVVRSMTGVLGRKPEITFVVEEN